MDRLKNKVALITGGAKGLGASIAHHFFNEGAKIILCDINLDEALKTAKKLNGTAYYMDVSNSKNVQDVFIEIQSKFKQLDILVNNAGITRDAPFHKMTKEQWSQVIDTNLTGVFNMTHPIWNGMRNRKFGRVINISSINGQKGQVGQVNYSAAKSGDIGFTKALAQEGAFKGITVNTVCPGYIATDMVKAVPENVRDAIISQIPVGRLGEAPEIARCVTFLASDDAGFITGSTITANGGQYIV